MPKRGLWYKNQQARSLKSSHAANVRWERYHKEHGTIYPPEIPKPDPLRRVTVEDFLTGISHVLTWHWIGKTRSFEIRVDGNFWKIGAWTASLEMTRKSCVRISRHME